MSSPRSRFGLAAQAALLLASLALVAGVLHGLRTFKADPTTAPPVVPTTGQPGQRPATYYVDSSSGDDSRAGSSPTTAWRTLAGVAKARLGPGTRLLLKRGGAWPGPLTVARSGREGAPVLVDTYGRGSLPKIHGGGSCVVITGSFVTVRHLHVDGCSWAGVDISGSRNRIERSLVTHNAVGVHVRRGALGNAVQHLTLQANNRMSVLTKRPDDDSGAFGILLQGDATEVAFNTISGSDAFSYDYGRDGAAVEVYGGRDNSVHHNLAVDNHAFTELGHSRSSGNSYAYNVVRSSLASSVFLVTRGRRSGYGPVVDTRLANNTVLLTGASSQGFVCHGGCGEDILTMRNNLIQAVGKVGYADAPLDEDHGLYFGGPRQFRMGGHSRVGDPRFVDPGGSDLRLRSTSPAVDQGVPQGYERDFDLQAVPQDGDRDRVATPDVGAFEYPALRDVAE